MPHDDDWRRHAECRGVDPRIFFRFDDETPAQHTLRERAAVALCNGCAVRRPCAEFAVANGIVDGVWGGLSESARQRLGDAAKRR